MAADKAVVLGRHEFFSGLAPRIIERLALRSRQATYPPGKLIFQRGDEGLALFAVLSGVVRISIPSSEGREIALNLIGANEIFGEIALIDGEPRTADATTLTRCELLTLDKRDFVPIVMDEPAIALKLLAVMSRRLRRTSVQVEDMTFGDPPGRLAKVLLRIAEVQGTRKDGTPRVTITQRELGRTIGLSRESTNRHLRDWETGGTVRLEKGACVIVDAARLARIAAQG